MASALSILRRLEEKAKAKKKEELLMRWAELLDWWMGLESSQMTVANVMKFHVELAKLTAEGQDLAPKP